MAALRRPRLTINLLALLAAGAVAASAAFAGASGASGAGELAVLSVEHEPAGRIIASLGVRGDALGAVRASVDGIPRPASVTREASTPASVVIAIDTSGSMAGAPIQAARAAAVSLTGRLADADHVAVVSFADAPLVLSTFEAGREAAVAALTGLEADGDTALYDALGQSIGLLAARQGPRMVVVLSDGEDFSALTPGGVRADGRREASLRAIEDSGVQLYAFALGAEADHDFLEEASRRGGGAFWSVTDNAALEQLFSRLGSRLGSSTEVTIEVPPLEQGEHTLQLSATVDGEPAEASVPVAVTNDGLLTATLAATDAAAGADGGPLVVALESSEADALEYRATTGSQPLEVLGRPPRVLIDPWRFAPGPLAVAVSAHRGGGPLASTALTVEVPELAPELTVETEAGAAGRVAVVSGRVQAAEDVRLEVRRGGEVVASGAGPELRVDLPEDGGSFTAALFAGGAEVATAPLTAQAAVAEGTTPRSAIVVGALAVAAGGVALIVLRRRRQRAAEDWRPTGRMMLVGQRVPGTMDAHQMRGVLLVQPPLGAEQRYEVFRAPLSLGSGPDCDVVIDDPRVAALHARLYALEDGNFRIHGIAPRGGVFQKQQDEWIVAHPGEQIAIGSYVLTVLSADAAGSGREGAA